MSYLNICILILTLVLGLCVGSFLNVVIYRLPNNMSLLKPSSHCPKCNYKLKWYHNIPVFSYLFLKGRCSNCKERISIKYLLVELTNMIFWFLCLLKFTDVIISTNNNDYIMFVVSCLAISTLICIFFCDLEHLEIPDELQIFLLLLGLIGLLSKKADYSQNIYGFFVGGGFFCLFSWIFYLIRKKEGLGFGDVKLMAVLGLLLGLSNIILTILISSVTCAIILVTISIKNKGGLNKEYPFAVFIVPSAILCLFIGDIITMWYQSLFYVL